MKITTVKELRKAIREMTIGETILIEGWGQITKCGHAYAIGPLPENDDSDLMRDYTAWSYGWKQTWIIDNIKRNLNLT